MIDTLPLKGVIILVIIVIFSIIASLNHMDEKNVQWFTLVIVSASLICEILRDWLAERRDYTASPKSKEEIALTQIEKIGYQWAKEPWHTSGIYIYARDVKAAPVGHHPGPDGAILYKAADVNSNEMFFWNGHTTHAVIDVCNRVHIKPDSMGLLAVDDGKLIIPDNAYIIRNFKEAEDFINFFHVLKKYRNPKALTAKTQDYTWDTELYLVGK